MITTWKVCTKRFTNRQTSSNYCLSNNNRLNFLAQSGKERNS